MARKLEGRFDMKHIEDTDASIYAFCYEGNRQIVTDPDEEKTGAPCCKGDCARCLL